MYAGAAEEFEASAIFRGMIGAVSRPRIRLITWKRAFDSHSRNQFWVTPSLVTERACKACAFARARFDSAVTHHLKMRTWSIGWALECHSGDVGSTPAVRTILPG